MAKSIEKRNAQNATAIGMRKDLALKIAAHTPLPGENTTSVPGMALYRRTTPTACFLATYEPSLTVFVQGRKRVNLNGVLYLCDGSSFLLSSIDVPAESQIIEASERVPMLSMFLRLDMPTVREVLSGEDLPEPASSAKPRGIAVGETTVGLLDACSRLIDLLDTPGGHPISRPSHPARDPLPDPSHPARRTAPRDRNDGRPQPPHRTRHRLASHQLRQAPAHRRPRNHGADGRLNAAPPVPCSDGDEPASISEAASPAGGAAAHADGRDGCHQRGLRGWIRKRQPV